MRGHMGSNDMPSEDLHQILIMLYSSGQVLRRAPPSSSNLIKYPA